MILVGERSAANRAAANREARHSSGTIGEEKPDSRGASKAARADNPTSNRDDSPRAAGINTPNQGSPRGGHSARVSPGKDNLGRDSPASRDEGSRPSRAAGSRLLPLDRVLPPATSTDANRGAEGATVLSPD